MNAIFRTTLLVVLAASSGAACTTTRAASPVERPALDVPPPPPREIVPLPAPDAPPMLEPVENLPVTTGDRPTKPRPPREKPDPGKPVDPKVEPPVEAPVPPPTQQPAPQLRLENQNGAQMRAQIGDAINRAKAILEKIERNSLTTEPRRKAYDDAKLFAEQAADAMKNNNFVFAKELAEKAERFAKELQGR